MSHNNTQHYAQLIDLAHVPECVRIEEGRRGNADWFNSYDSESGHPAIAWVTWASTEDGVTDEGFDLEGLDAFISQLDDNIDVDQDHGVKVELCPEWLHYYQHQSIAA